MTLLCVEFLGEALLPAHGGCQPVSRPVPWACVSGLWVAFILGIINNNNNNI